MFRADHPATLEQLRAAAPRPPRRAGGYWKPLPHHVLVQTVIDSCLSRDVTPGEVVAELSRGGQDAVIRLDVRAWGHPPPEGLTFCLGLVNSNAQQVSLTMYAGLRDPATGAGLPLYVYPLGKHTDGLLPGPAVRAALNWLRNCQFDAMCRLHEKSKATPVADGAADRACVRAAETRAITGTRALRALLRWRAGRPTCHRLLWCYAEENAATPPFRAMEGCYQFCRGLLRTATRVRHATREERLGGPRLGGGGLRDDGAGPGRDGPEVPAAARGGAGGGALGV